MGWLRSAGFLIPLAIAASASAVIIDTATGTEDTTAPPVDPGWDYVGTCNGLTCVYLGNGWVLTANHVGPGDATFGGVVYPWISGTSVQLHNPDTSNADLVIFEISTPRPPLGSLSIVSATPPLGTGLVMIGNGHDRGAVTSWHSIGGYLWAQSTAKRWGTNNAEDVQAVPDIGTQFFGSIFDPLGTTEAQAAVGDSGGGVFAWNGSSYDLAGIMLGIAVFTGQPSQTALYGNYTLDADLSVYRDEIVSTMPEPAGELPAGAAVVAVLARRRRARLAPQR